MGCVTSRNVEYPNDIHPNIFTVATVNRNSAKSVYGQLEVTPFDLVLHRLAHDPISWPLHFVKRYGYENNIFSFESGRRCESGAGIFTFRCRRAQELFLLVQTCIQEQRADSAAPEGPSARRRVSRTRTGTNEYLPSIGTSVFVDYDDTGDEQPIVDNDISVLTNSALNAEDDTESTSQVFMEITPLSASYHVGQTGRPPINSTSSSSLNPFERRRPHSVELINGTNNGTAIYYNSTVLIAPPMTIPASPPDSCYMNVNPPANGTVVDPKPKGSKGARPYIRLDGLDMSSAKHKMLNYVLIDTTSGAAACSPSLPQTAPPWPMRSRRLSNQSSTYRNSGDGSCGGESSTESSSIIAASNYATIDSTRTKALRDTSAHRIGSSSEDSAGFTSRRTRHDSSIDAAGKRTLEPVTT